MSTEWGALVGWFPVDEMTLAYLEARNRELRAQGVTRIPEEKFAEWRANPPAPDPDAVYAATYRARSGRGHAACLRAGHGTGDAIGRRDREEESCHPEGVSRLLRELAAGRSGGGSARSYRVRQSQMACSSISLPPAAQSRKKRRSAASGRSFSTAGAQPLPSGCGPVHRAGHGTARGGRSRHLRHQPQFQGTHGLARRAMLSRKPRGGGGVGGRGLHLRSG